VKYINNLNNQHMHRDKPLWEMHFYENYTAETSILFMRMHHSFTDGVGYVSMMS